MTEQWRDLKETIIEMRDNDGTCTQQGVCKFLVNYMEILEKQMQEPILDKVRDEISQLPSYVAKFAGDAFAIHIDKEKVLQIIDKYRGEIMKLIIDIDEDVYTRLFDTKIQDKEIATDDVCKMARALRHGTPLPKGHGRLIDADDIDNHIIGHVDTRSCPTIIEADKDCRECKVEHDCYECKKYTESEDD